MSDGRQDQGPAVSDERTDHVSVDGCPLDRGPTMVRAGDFCIDSTEVTIAQYDAFLAAKNGDTSGQPAKCSWNVSYASDVTQTSLELPITGIDWCDALAFCAWAGKRLCGSTLGGSLAWSSGFSTTGQWYSACSHVGTQQYPYGDVLGYRPSACNTSDAYVDGGPKPAVKPVGSMNSCVGGYAGLYDITGNAWEWIDSCNDNAGAADKCLFLGGSYLWGDPYSSCKTPSDKIATNLRSKTFPDLGFRCCSP